MVSIWKREIIQGLRGEGMPNEDEIRKAVEESFGNLERLPEQILRERVQTFALTAGLVLSGTGGVDHLAVQAEFLKSSRRPARSHSQQDFDWIGGLWFAILPLDRKSTRLN